MSKPSCPCTKCRKERKVRQSTELENRGRLIEQPILARTEGKSVHRTPNKNKTKTSVTDHNTRSNDNECTTKCHKSVDVKVDVIPEVIYKQIENKNRTSFEIELDVNSSPNCRVVKKKTFDPVCGKVVTKYVLLVESDVKLDCTPKIKQIGGKPYAKYEMDIIVDTDQHIK